MSMRPLLAIALLVAAAPCALGQTSDPSEPIEGPAFDPPGQADPNRGYQDVGGGATPVGVNSSYGENPAGGFAEESRDDEGAASWLPVGVIFTFLIAITLVVLYLRVSRRS